MEVAVNPCVCNTAGHPVALLEEVSNGVFHENVDAFVNAAFLECPNDLETRCVTNVGKAREGVSAEVSLVDEVLRSAVEDGAPLFEFAHSVGCFFGMVFCHFPVGKPLASLHCVVEVNLPPVTRVGVLQGGCTATFSHNGVRLAEKGFGDDGGLCAASRSLNGGSQASASSADHNNVVFVLGYRFSHHHHLKSRRAPCRSDGPLPPPKPKGHPGTQTQVRSRTKTRESG